MIMSKTSMNTVFIDEYSEQKKEIAILRNIASRLAKEKQDLEIKIELLTKTICELRDKLENK